MARVARNTSGCGCTEASIGMVIYCADPFLSPGGPAWLLAKPRNCPNCGWGIFGFLDADLDPIRPPAPERAIDTPAPAEQVGA